MLVTVFDRLDKFGVCIFLRVARHSNTIMITCQGQQNLTAPRLVHRNPSGVK